MLLSLLATTIYVGHASLMREVLSMILRTVGPLTIGRYLAFAVGEGLGEEEWDGQHHEGAKGLQKVARPILRKEGHIIEEIDLSLEPQTPVRSNHRDSTDSDIKVDDDDSKVGGSAPVVTVTRSISDASTTTLRARRVFEMSKLGLEDESSSAEAYLPHFYGFASNKIGEACVCWLARWGVDILAAELGVLIDSELSFRIWAHRGLPGRFVKALISSDSFFVKDEMERYRVAREVLDLRRKGWEAEMDSRGDISVSYETEGGMEEWDEDEIELAKVFADGIYYSHMVRPFTPGHLRQAD
jgi:hypothetical protein